MRIAVDGARVDAEVAWLPAARADAVVALAGDELLFVREGIRVRALPGAGLRAAGACALRLESAPIARARSPIALGAERARARARLYAASLLLGVLRDACDFSRGYALERRAFGRPIAHHQALAFLITDMQMALDGARLLVHEAAWRVDAGLPCAGAAAAAFAQCIEASRLIGPAGVQILGGHGFMADYPMEKAMRESRALGLWLGGFDAAIEDAGRELCDSAAAPRWSSRDRLRDRRRARASELADAREWGAPAMRPGRPRGRPARRAAAGRRIPTSRSSSSAAAAARAGPGPAGARARASASRRAWSRRCCCSKSSPTGTAA